MRKIVVSFIIVIWLFPACDGPYYRVVVEEVVPAEEYYDYEEKDAYNPNIVDPYSEDTNWYIDEVGNIVWKSTKP